jgi:bifunctional non-homologous end joining protein LigD
MSLLRHRIRITGFAEPCLPSLADKPPSGGDWIHEIKLDGYRLMARRDGRGVRLFTRRGDNWPSQFPLVAAAISRLECRTCIIDGEVVAPGPDGVPSFELLRRKHPAVLYAFDLIELDGTDLRYEPIETRKAVLTTLVRSAGLDRGIMLNDHMEGEAREVFEHAWRLGFEGIVSKRCASRYESGRSRHWLKMKNLDSAAAKREAEEEWSG